MKKDNKTIAPDYIHEAIIEAHERSARKARGKRVRSMKLWRTILSTLGVFAIIGLTVTIYYATQKPCQEYYVCDQANLCCGIER